MSDSTLRRDAAAPAPAQPRVSAVPVAARGGVDWLFGVAVLLVAITFVRVIWFTPLEALQGAAQKIFYLHLPAAFIALYIAFPLVVLMSVLYLWLKDLRFDRIAEASAEVGVVFTTVVLTTGPLWGKPIWGTWWTWDARLTLTLFLWFIYVGYLVLRGAIDDAQMRARYSAVLGILGALLIPFIHLSVYLFRTLHPMPVVLKPSAPSLPPDMLKTLLLSFVSFAVLYVALLRARVRLATERAALEMEDRR
jgi:heme exporter protein C